MGGGVGLCLCFPLLKLHCSSTLEFCFRLLLVSVLSDWKEGPFPWRRAVSVAQGVGEGPSQRPLPEATSGLHPGGDPSVIYSPLPRQPPTSSTSFGISAAELFKLIWSRRRGSTQLMKHRGHFSFICLRLPKNAKN